MKYQYINPIDKGYTKTKLSKEQRKELHIPDKWNRKQDFYINEHNSHILIEQSTPIWIRLLETLLLPVYFAWHLGCRTGELIIELPTELYQMWFPKKTGSFVEDRRILNKEQKDGMFKATE